MDELGFASQVNQFLEAFWKSTRTSHVRLKTSHETGFSSYVQLRNLAHNSKLMENAMIFHTFFDTNRHDFTIDKQNFCTDEDSKISLAVKSFKSSTNSSRKLYEEVRDQPQRNCESAYNKII